METLMYKVGLLQLRQLWKRVVVRLLHLKPESQNYIYILHSSNTTTMYYICSSPEFTSLLISILLCCRPTLLPHCSGINRNSSFIFQDFFHFPMLIHNGDTLNIKISQSNFEKFQSLSILKKKIGAKIKILQKQHPENCKQNVNKCIFKVQSEQGNFF